VIDWLTFRAPLDHVIGEGGPFWAGEIISTVPDPERGEAIEWQTLKRLPVEGSYSNRITVQSTQIDGAPAIWVSGCPAKWFQGHNVHGSDDVHGLALEMLDRLCRGLGVVPSAANRAAWESEGLRLTRVDVTYSWDVGTLPRARNFLRSLGATSHLRHRGPGVFKGETLYFGKGSTRKSLKVYPKGLELEARPLPLDLAESSLQGHAQGLVRFELCMRSKSLAARGLDRTAAWCDTAAQELHAATMATLEISGAVMLTPHELEGLPRHLLPVYQLWRDGHDLRALYSARTFYRHRAALKAHGVDISVKQPREADSNIVPIRAVLVAQPATVPDWLIGTPWYFEPRAKVA
jgi:II/X family phage/plasmid replication protein